jgi:methanethiol S-methyltransferase
MKRVITAISLIPSLLFFIWVERGCALPMELQLGAHGFGWPWIDLRESSLPVLILWNLFLIQAFGVTHSVLAQTRFEKTVDRSLYIIITGWTLFLVMAFWQNTGVMLWNYGGTFWSSFVFYGLCVLVMRLLTQFGFTEFLGIGKADVNSQVQAQPVLQTTGFFKFMRHPVYFFTVLAFAASLHMSLDRMIVVAGVMGYLFFAVPVEEKKLVAKFGSRYEEYQRKVPAVFPKLW